MLALGLREVWTVGYRSHAWLRNLIVAVVLVAGVGCAVAFALSPSRSQDTASDASPAASPDGDAPQPQSVTPEVVENTSDAKKLDQGITFSGPDPAKTEDGAQAGSGTPAPDNVQRGWKWVATDDGSGGNDGGKAVYCDDAGGHLQTGSATIDGVEYHFNETTGALELGAQWIQGEHFNHGTKAVQKYIVLHDTEVAGSPASVVEGWKNSRSGAVAAHFVIGRDGSLVQCGRLNQILHHAGWGGPGDFDSKFGVGSNDGKGNGDDLYGVTPWSGYTSYGMNSYSVGIEMVHLTGQDYPEAQLDKLDQIIRYIDTYFGFQSTIIKHRDWRPSNSDTEPNFDPYFESYQRIRRHH